MKISSSEILEKGVNFNTFKDFIKMYLVCHEHNNTPFILDVYIWDVKESSFCYCYYGGIVQWRYYEPISKQNDLFPNKGLAEDRIMYLNSLQGECNENV